jgi:hypothetical protein
MAQQVDRQRERLHVPKRADPSQGRSGAGTRFAHRGLEREQTGHEQHPDASERQRRQPSYGQRGRDLASCTGKPKIPAAAAAMAPASAIAYRIGNAASAHTTTRTHRRDRRALERPPKQLSTD